MPTSVYSSDTIMCIVTSLKIDHRCNMIVFTENHQATNEK